MFVESRSLPTRVELYNFNLSWREQIFCRAAPGEISFQIRSDYVSYGKQACFVYTMELFQRFTLFYYGDTCICEQKRERNTFLNFHVEMNYELF